MGFLSPSPKIDAARVTAAIVAAELRTSGEIRVVTSRSKVDDPVGAARSHFDRLGMQSTASRNGVLIFIAAASRNFAIVGDRGVHEKCGQAFWDEVAASMSGHFKRGDFTAGVVEAIERAGSLLAQHFPRGSDDRNELPDKIEESEA